MAESKHIISVPKQQSRDLEEKPIAAVLELSLEQQAQIKVATGHDIKKLEFTKVELDLVMSPAGYDAPGAANG
jgi:hypothetical protein